MVKDSSGRNHHGTLIAVSWENGHAGKALRFDGRQSAVDCGTAADFDFKEQQDFTIDYWVQVPVDAPSGFGNMVNKKTNLADPGEPGYALYLTPDFRVSAVIADGLHGICLKSQTPVNDGAWHHIALVVKRNEAATLLIDRQSEAKASLSEMIDIRNPKKELHIGHRGHGDGYFSGLMDEVRISNYARSSFD